ncbi:glycosyltransferase family 4 protein [Nonomuraea sp. NPDC048901]|uniref:glycosyltransferase family 4 protein n=1 Tax=Nonomuraea sp. NPDC048901 TaxID=3155627 RepID=UPI0033FD804B
MYRPTEAEDAPRRSGSDRCDDWCPETYARLVRELCRDVSADALVTQFVLLSRCHLGLTADTLRVIDADNLFADRREGFAAAGLDYWWFSTSRQDEDTCLRRADLLVCIQPQEATTLSDRSGVDAMVVPHTASPAVCPPATGSGLLYVGSANPVNIDAIGSFISAGLPQLRAAGLDTRLTVCGGVCAHLRESPDIVLAGVIGDLWQQYVEAAVVLNPAAVGTGVSIKTVDAIAHGKCLVTTAAGASGIPGIDRAARVVPSQAHVPAAVIDLLRDAALIRHHERRAAEAARQMADTKALAVFEQRILTRRRGRFARQQPTHGAGYATERVRS